MINEIISLALHMMKNQLFPQTPKIPNIVEIMCRGFQDIS